MTCVFVLLSMTAGCQHYYADPFGVPYAGAAEVTTPSSRRLAEQQAAPEPRQRGHEVTETRLADGTIVHGPLYFEDHLLLQASDDDQFRLTWEDYVGFPLGDGRFLLNLAASPVSMVVYPPWTAAHSTGADDLSVAGSPPS